MGGSSCIIIGFSFAGTFGCESPMGLGDIPHSSTDLLFLGRSPWTLSLIIAGLVVLIVAGFYEVRTTRDALFPRTAFTDRTTSESLGSAQLLTRGIHFCLPVIILVVNFLHNLCFNAGTFYLALYFQVCGLFSLLSTVYLEHQLTAVKTVQGLEPLVAGISMLPYSLGSSISSMPGLSPLHITLDGFR